MVERSMHTTMSHPRFRSQTEADRFFMQMAMETRRSSDDPKARMVLQSGVGAVIVGEDGVVGRSANVLPPRLAKAVRDDGGDISEADRYHRIEHAERAAIYEALLAGNQLAGATLYCTRFPCSDCARAIVWAGISRTVFPTGFAGEARWLEAQRAALRIMREAGVKVRYLSPLAD